MNKKVYLVIIVFAIGILAIMITNMQKEQIVMIENGDDISRIRINSNNIIEDKAMINDIVNILKKYDTEKTINPFPMEMAGTKMEIDYVDNQKIRHIILGKTNIIYESGDGPVFEIIDGEELLRELKEYLDAYLNMNNDMVEIGNTENTKLSDNWLQNPSKDPIEVVQSAIENQAEKEYTISMRFIKAVIDDKETQRKIESYKGSKLAERRGWSDIYLMDHFLIVKASYYVEYNHGKTFMNDGNIKQYFYLTRNTDTGLWSIIDNSTPERIFKDSGEEYKNEKYGFTFKIPDNWKGKHEIVENEGENYSRVSFLYTEYEDEDSNFQEFFSIMIYNEKTFNEYESKNEEFILAMKEGNVFYYSTPLDSAIDNEEAAEEFINLKINHVKAKELFSID